MIRTVLRVRPRTFGYNPETAASNPFQRPGGGAAIADAARREADALADRLAAAGVEVLTLEDDGAVPLPDAVFPNNWLSLHRGGLGVLYPMQAPSRRRERRPEAVEAVLRAAGRPGVRWIDLTPLEERGLALEGTGSLILDRDRTLAFAALSGRTDAQALEIFSQTLGYEILTFGTLGPGGVPVYHTNVLLALGPGFALLCADVILPADRPRVLERLEATDREVVPIDGSQMLAFAANALALAGSGGAPLLALSEGAWASLGPAQRRAVERHATPVLAALPIIERHGGGGVRCCLAEVEG